MSPRPLYRLHVWLLAALAAVGSLGMLSCNEETPPPVPARFNRPNRVEFVCVNGLQVVPLPQCEGISSENELAPHALVTQTGRGEIAVVNMRRPAVVIDSRRDIPGYTFIPVGESPRAIITPRDHPQQTYVASFGSRDVRVLRTRALVLTVPEKPDAQRVLLRDAGSDALLAPIDMVLAPDESALFVAVADSKDGGLVLRLPIVRCDASSGPECEDGLIDEAGITALPLRETTVPPPVAGTPSVYQQLCTYERQEQVQPAQLEITQKDLDPPARPSALAIDAYCQGEGCPRLLVADSALPVIHAVDIDAWAASGSGGALLPAIPAGAPTTDVVVTPRVPRTIAGEGETQYAYAIDARDGSVLAFENDQLLAVHALAEGVPPVPGERPDRLHFIDGEEGALALEVVTPEFEVDGPAAQYVGPSTDQPLNEADPKACTDADYTEQDPARLRGVFLTVARTDGTVRVFDVHDMELRANDGGMACRQCATEPSGIKEDDAATPDTDERRRPIGIPVLVRNHERLATSFVPMMGQEPASFVPEAQLRYIVDGAAYSIRDNGSTASPRAPGLACMRKEEDESRVCPNLTKAFPDDSDADEDDEPPPPAAPDAGMADAGMADGGMSDGGMTHAGMTDGGAGQPASPDDCSGEDSALLCVANDPWSSGEGSWNAIYESVLVGTSRSRGHFVEPGQPGNQTSGLELMTTDDPCTAGVLGEEDITADYGDCPRPVVDKETGEAPRRGVCEMQPERCVEDPAGDQVVIDSPPLRFSDRTGSRAGLDDEEIERCRELSAALDADRTLRVAFEIRRAYRDRLVLRTTLLRPVGDFTHFDEIKQCYESSVGFEVRSSQAFTVRGTFTGFQHRVVATGSLGRCQVDDTMDPLLAGRARLGCTFRNHSLQFALPAADPDNDPDQLQGVRLDLGFSSNALKLGFQGGNLGGFGAATVVTEQLRYNPVDKRLYLVDINDRGLVPIGLQPFPPVIGSNGQFN